MTKILTNYEQETYLLRIDLQEGLYAIQKKTEPKPHLLPELLKY